MKVCRWRGLSAGNSLPLVKGQAVGVSASEHGMGAAGRPGWGAERSRPMPAGPRKKLRAEGLQACHMAVFLQTNPHRPDEAWHSGQRAGRIEPTSDSLALIAEALRMLRPLWVPGLRYSVSRRAWCSRLALRPRLGGTGGRRVRSWRTRDRRREERDRTCRQVWPDPCAAPSVQC